MLNLVQNQSNTCWTFAEMWGGTAPFTLELINNIDRDAKQSFVLSLSDYGDRKSYTITPTQITGTYDYTIKDDAGNVFEIGLAEITE